MTIDEALVWRMPHDTCEDCWYSCPASGECCDDSKPVDRCECWASVVNTVLDTLAAEVRRYQAMRCETCKHQERVDITHVPWWDCRLQGTELVEEMTGCLAWEKRDET